MRSIFFPLMTATALLFSVPRGAAAQSYNVTDLGIISGAATSRPLAINDAGLTVTGKPIIRVVGHTVTSKGAGYHAFYWDSVSRVMTDIGAFSGGQSGTARDVNSQGEVVGSAYTATAGNARAFYWNPARGASNLLALSQTLSGPLHTGTAASSNAVSINESGTIVGMVYTQAWGTVSVYWQKNSNGIYQCYELPGALNGAVTNEGGATGINANGDIVGTLPDPSGTGSARMMLWRNLGTTASPSYGDPVDSGLIAFGGVINNAGQVAANTPSPTSGAFFWDPGIYGPQDIGHLGYGSTRVWGINDAGQIVGESFVTSSARRAFIWFAGAGMTDLGTLGGASSWGHAINNSGVVVGLSQTAGTAGNQGFRWDPANGMKNLNDTALTPTKAPFSVLRAAKKISGLGNIVGEGILQKGGATRTYLLTPK